MKKVIKKFVLLLILVLFVPINSITINEENKKQTKRLDEIEKQLFNPNEKKLKKLSKIEKIVWSFKCINRDPLL